MAYAAHINNIPSLVGQNAKYLSNNGSILQWVDGLAPDLSAYYTSAQVDTLLASYVTSGTLTDTLVNYVLSSDLASASVSYAENAGHSTTSDTATSANSANSATNADSAGFATNADHANTADSATSAGVANSATTADNAVYATDAGNATTAGYASTANPIENDNISNIAIDWNSRYLYQSSTNVISLNWDSRTLNDTAGTAVFSWATSGVLTATNVNVSTNQQYINGYGSLTDASSVSWDLDAAPTASITLTAGVGANRTLVNPGNMKAGSSYILKVKQSSAGSNAMSFDTDYKFAGGTAPVLSTTANAVDVLCFWSDGTNMYGSIVKDMK